MLAYLKALGKHLLNFAIRYPVAIALTVLITAGVVFLAIFGQKIQIGGLLGKIWGTGTKTDPDARVLPPPKRVDDNGKPIEPGQSDDKGYVQAPQQVDIIQPGMFSDPNTITINDPTKGQIVIPLPTGVTNSDVQSVVIVAPNTYQIQNNDKPAADTDQAIKDLEGK